MAVKLNSTGGGSVTLDSPSTASNYTVTLPSAAGTLATTTGTGSVFTNPTINGFTGDTSAITIGTTQFVKDASGNVGIGTASPAALLHLSSGSGTKAIWGTTRNFAVNRNWQVSVDEYSEGQFAITPSTTLGGTTFTTPTMILNASGNLGLGVTPSGWSGSGNIDGQNGFCWSSYDASIGNGYYYNGGYKYKSTGAAVTKYAPYNGSHTWYTAASGTAGNAISFTQAMTLDANGDLLVGMTTPTPFSGTFTGNIACKSAVYFGGGTNSYYYSIQANTSDFYIGNSTLTRYAALIGITTFTGWTFGSDKRIKKDIKPIDYGLKEILNLKPSRFTFISDKESTVGFIAQEVKDVVPEAISGSGLEFDKTDTPQERAAKTLGINKELLIPVLVKAIQELSAQNNALEARLAQLEAK